MAVLSSTAIAAPERRVPLVVDLDDTLLRTDSAIETLFVLVRHRPSLVLLLPWYLLRGIAAFKRMLAQRALAEIRILPYRAGLLDFLKQEKKDGRYLALATAADQLVADRVARELGLFDAVFASDGKHNLSGARKRARLVDAFGDRGFDYIGDDASSPSWRAALHAWEADDAGLLQPDTSRRRSRTIAHLKALRPQHWVKNALVFLPLLVEHRLTTPNLLSAMAAFCAFSAAASAIYVVNDLFDLESDRAHPAKRSRSIANGDVPLVHAVIMVPLLLVIAWLIAAMLPPAFELVVAGYLLAMLLYSMRLKDLPIVDVLTLGGGYAARVIGGAYAIGAPPAPWLFAFAALLFMSLALIKRYAELMHASGEPFVRKPYSPGDRSILAVQGIAGAYAALALLALHITRPVADAGGARTWAAWSACVLLFAWVNYAWLCAHRGRIPHDPVTFAFTDRLSIVLLVAAGVAATVAA